MMKERVSLAEFSLLFPHKTWKGMTEPRFDGLDAETEDIIAVAVDGDSVGALSKLSKERICTVPFPLKIASIRNIIPS